MKHEYFLQYDIVDEKNEERPTHRYHIKIFKSQEEYPSIVNTRLAYELNRRPLYDVFHFLDYHYSKFEGDKYDFISYVKNTMEESEFHSRIKEYEELNIEEIKERSRTHTRLLKTIEKTDEWIERKKNELTPESKNGGSSPEDEITLKRQLLILHYLGFIENNLGLSQNKLAEFLSTFLGKNLQNVRNALSGGKLGECKTEENLDYVHDLFKRYKFDTKEILKDLLKIHKSE